MNREFLAPRALSLSGLSLMLVVLLACSSPTGPAACGTIPNLLLYVGETDSIEPCFNDPSTTSLVFSAESSSPEVVAVEIEDNETVVLTALSPGIATISVEASNADGEMGSTDFNVEVPNRDPEAIKEPEPLQVRVDRSIKLILSEFFSDPDNQKLTYSTDEPEIIETSLSEDTLSITGKQAGRGLLTINASDGEATASIAFPFSVFESTVVFSDGFSNTNGGWVKSPGYPKTGMNIDTIAGHLIIWTEDSREWGLVVRRDVFATDWEIFARMRGGSGETDAGLAIQLEGRYSHLFLYMGKTSEDYQVYTFDQETQEWSLLAAGAFGLESEKTFADVRFRYENSRYHLSFNDNEPRVFGEDVAGNQMIDISFVAASLGRHSGRWVILDSILVSGIATQDVSNKASRNIPKPFLLPIGERR